MTTVQRLILKAIERYQQRGGGVAQFRVDCNFEPSCSEYARQAICHYGVLHGSRLAIGRIRRCCDRDQVSKIVDPPIDRYQPGKPG